jgi:integration host factor subunit alpha
MKHKAKTITKQKISNAITSNIGISNTSSKEIVDLFFKMIEQGLKEDGIVKISRFGTFQILNKKERLGRNPKSMEDAIITSRKVATFKVSEVIRDKLNKRDKN